MKDSTADMNWLQSKVRDWARRRGIFTMSTPLKQWEKLVEEVNELRLGITQSNEEEIVDGIGDCLVVLTNLAEFYNLSLNECLEHAWVEIADRRGKMVGGMFVKEGRD